MGDELDILKDLLRDADNQVIEIRKLTKETLKSVGFTFDVVDIFDHFTKDQVAEFNDDQILGIYSDYYENTTGIMYPDEYDERIAKIKEALLSVADECIFYNSVVEKRVELSEQYHSMIDELLVHGESPEGKAKALESYETLKANLLTETDPVKKAEVETKIKIRDESKTLSFVFDRIDKFSDKEVRSITDTMFDNGRFRAAMTRCEKVLKRLKIDDRVLQSFVNLEEKFLGQEYYPFNNLFLVFTIRYIGYCDTNREDNSAFARILISKLNKLVRHNFHSQEEEEFIIDIIRKFDDKFTEYRDLFVKKNKANPESEYRRNIDETKRETTISRIKEIAKENGYDAIPDLPYPELVKWTRDVQEKGFLMHWFDTFKIEYSPEMSLDELRAIREDMKAKTALELKEAKKQEDLDDNHDDSTGNEPVAVEASTVTE